MSEATNEPIDVPAELVQFVSNSPYGRPPILELALRAARELPAGSRLLDVGAADSPYRCLFPHIRYETSDWEQTYHDGGRRVDYVGPAHDLPVADGEFDAVLCTQVLEHVPNPQAVLNELHRLLRPGGRVYLSLPFTWPLHELPYDFFRYAPHGMAVMLEQAGFVQCDIRAGNDTLGTLSEMLRKSVWTIGSYPDGRDHLRDQVIASVNSLADQLDTFVGLDARWLYPLTYTVAASKPDGTTRAPAASEIAAARDALGLRAARRYVTLCFAQDVLNDQFLLPSYAEHFRGADDATLVIYAPETEVAAAGAALTARIEQLGLDGPDSPDMIGLPLSGRADEAVLALAVDAVLATRPPWGAFTGLPWAYPGAIADLRGRATNR